MQKKFNISKIKEISSWRLIPDFFIKNFPQKIVAVLLAITIWAYSVIFYQTNLLLLGCFPINLIQIEN